MAPTAESAKRSRKRPWLAAILSILPGLGHLYLRLWGRALLWLGLWMLASFLVMPETSVVDSFSLEAFMSVSDSISLGGTVLLSGVLALCVVDAFLMGRRINYLVAESERIAAGQSPSECPNCGKELDPDIEFCHWCTTELDRFDEEN